MRGFLRTLVGLAALAALGAPTAAADTIADGKAFITSYIVLTNTYRQTLGDLYADDAALRVVTRLADGTSREIHLTGAAYRTLLPKALPLARKRGEQVQFSDIRYTSEGDRIRITALRHALTDDFGAPGYSAPHVMVIARDGLGRWLIVEEAGEASIDPAAAEQAAPGDPPPVAPPDAPAPLARPATVEQPRPAAPAAPKGLDPVVAGKMFLDVLLAKHNTYDPSVGNLYADHAEVVVETVGPDGTEMTVRRTGKQVKAEAGKTLAEMRRRGVRMNFTEASYQAEGERIRISGKTRDPKSGLVAPHALLIERDASGRWVIVEETIAVRAPAKGRRG
jgi:hypothetical protein